MKKLNNLQLLEESRRRWTMADVAASGFIITRSSLRTSTFQDKYQDKDEAPVTLPGASRQKMREVILKQPGQLVLQDSPKPEIRKDHEVLLRVTAVGVCGSDIHYFTSGKIGSQIVQYPFRTGHEFAGVVEQTGAAVSGLNIGDLVAVDPCISCGSCVQCAAGRRHTCLRQSFFGCPGQTDGCLAEFIVLPAENCFAVRGNNSAAEAAFVEPLSIGYYAASFMADTRAENVGILGAGPIGLSVLLSGLKISAADFYITDKLDYRCRFAESLGAFWTGNPRSDNIEAQVTENVPQLLDIVFECCGEQEALDQGIELLKPGGTLIIVGIPGPDRISFDISKIRRKEILIRNIRRQNECMQPALDLVESGAVDTKPLITHTFSLEQTQQAFELVANYSDNVIKAMIEVK